MYHILLICRLSTDHDPGALDRLLGLAYPRICRDRRQSRRHICSPEYCKVCLPFISGLPCHALTHADVLLHSQFHHHDDSALSVLAFAVDVVGVEHGKCPHYARMLPYLPHALTATLCPKLYQSSLRDTPNAAVHSHASKPFNPLPRRPQPRTPPLAAGSPHSLNSSRRSTSHLHLPLPIWTPSSRKTSSFKLRTFVSRM